MKQGHLPWLLVALAVMLVLKIVDGTRSPAVEPASPAVARVQAVVAANKPSPVRTVAPGALALPQADKSFQVALAMRSEAEPDEPRNAFAVRQPPPSPPAPPTPPTPPAPKPMVGPPVPPPPPPEPPAPNYQVIGTWQDAGGASVFVSSAMRTAQVRAGDVLFAEYRVVQITPTQVVIRQLNSQREYRLAVAQGPGQLR